MINLLKLVIQIWVLASALIGGVRSRGEGGGAGDEREKRREKSRYKEEGYCQVFSLSSLNT